MIHKQGLKSKAVRALRYGRGMPEPMASQFVHIEPGGDLWGRLRHWLEESIGAIDTGNFSRLPETLCADGGRAARETYETVLMAMEILETGSLKPKAS